MNDLRIGDDVLETETVATTVTPTLVALSDATPREVVALDIADELHTHLRALESFFQWQHHPFAAEGRAHDFSLRDCSPETRIAHEILLRARHLTLQLQRDDTLTESLDDDINLDAHPDAPLALDAALLNETDAVLGDACAICEGLLLASQIGFRTWSSLGRILEREFERIGIVTNLEIALREYGGRDLHPMLRSLIEKVEPATLGADMRQILQGLTDLLSRLRRVAPLLKADRPLKQTLPLWTLIHTDAKHLISFIEKRALRTDELEGGIFDALDSTAYALSMELRKVFAHELSDVAATRSAPLIYSKIETAHGLLRDSFQQSIITLAQSLDQNISALDLFDIVRTKLEQSIALRDDLWTLLTTIRQHERDPTAASHSLAEVIESCRKFRDGSMQHLMYKDWEAFDLFVEELTRARTLAEAIPVLHRFATYLDALHGQINMRAVLKDHPFDPRAHAAPSV